MVCIVLLLSLAAVWISNKTVGLLEIHYFKRPLSMEYAAWLRVMCAGLLFIFIQMVPAFTFLYTLKLVALLNLGVQTMKLNGVYKFKRTGMMPPKDAPHEHPPEFARTQHRPPTWPDGDRRTGCRGRTGLGRLALARSAPL